MLAAYAENLLPGIGIVQGRRDLCAVAALKPKLDELMEKFATTGVAHLPLYEALQLGRRALDTGFSESAEARKLFSRPVEEQVRFMTRCNVGIIPALRDRFVEHHVSTRSEIRSNVLARFGSVMR